ncbi:MAG: hypothetical protein ACW99G_15300 [Candidatus Thorarchaeota archaeon]|jgi:hypothetical protein
MDNTCKAKVGVGVRRDGTEIQVDCGKWYAGQREFCSDCVQEYLDKYPQGWRYYPGDVCQHGTYVGGCGVDHLCMACELDLGTGDPEPTHDTRYKDG